MEKNLPFLKLFVVLFFSTAFIFSFSHFGAKAFEKLAIADGKYSEGTTVGNLDISGKTDSEAASMLEKEYLDWLKNTKFSFQYSEKSVPFDLNLFNLDSETTIKSIKDGQKNQVFISIDLMQVEEQVSILFPELNSNEVDFTKLKANLESTASGLENGSYPFNLTNDFLLASASKKDMVISEAVLKLKEIPYDLQTIVEKNSEIKIAEGATFSLLEFAKNQKFEKATALSFIGTGIYQAILPTNFSVVDRNISNVLPEYARLGFEARVSPAKNTDLIITNPNKSSYTIELVLENNLLKVRLKGKKFLYNYKISKKDEQQLKPKTIVQYSPILKPGKTMVKAKGADGTFVKVYREMYQGEQLLKTELISEDYYPPVYRIEIHALTGTQQGTAATAASQTDIVTNPSTETNPAGSQTTSQSDTSQQDSDVDNLWGKPNEQPK
ncbi:G5 domain-containing protein [Bacillus sp. sid0103]|uniref:G5 domain-containing protein n=1 Tax=Bacillus sp. sid0103 TaxID=2856337 RepID=UPI001C450BE2|nr:G5 domain-containing protein [Bacillus sp. sid0103]MBV7505996.1 G5 domain-containing protein [Bacillus sp. sid0103]